MCTVKTKSQNLYYGMYILSMLIFGTNGLLVSRISLQSSQIVLLRTLIGGALLTVIVLLRGGFDRNAVRADLPMILLGGTALGLNWVALFSAYRLLNVSLATLIYYIGPILVLLFSPIIFREKLTGTKIAAVAIVAVGLVCISGSILVGGMNPVGFAAAIATYPIGQERFLNGAATTKQKPNPSPENNANDNEHENGVR